MKEIIGNIAKLGKAGNVVNVAQTTSETGANSSAGPNTSSRDFYDPLGTTPPAAGVTLEGTAAGEELSGAVDTSGPGLPGALSFYSFANASGAGSATFADLRGGPSVTAYIDTGETATVSATLRAGPDGSPNSALEFDGDDTFAYLEHSPAWEVPQGTIALWVQPDDLSDDGMFLSKDLKGSGDGGHFRFGHEEDGTLFLRFANGDGSGNRAWESSIPYLEEGEWTHLAVSFSAEDGIVVYVDGVAVPDAGWIRTEGNEDLLSLQSEAYLTANREPWILGADTSRSEDTDSPNAFAAEHDGPRDAFDGALADFGIWGGPSADDVLSAEEVLELATNGPGNALTNPAGPQAMVAAADTINGGGGNDTIHGDAGDDILRGGAGEDSITGGYGNDRLEGDAGDDVLEGGRGSDLLLGGDGDDVLISHSDAGEQRIGQVAIGQPTRPDPDNEVNPERQKLYGWEDQPLIADDILVGGDGADTFLFNPQINGKRDIILQHVNDDRTIDWAGVAGENDELHDHWIDSFGIDVIADYVADEDTISIVGHTVAPRVEQRLIDTDGDGVLDEAISIITVYSMQHGGGGAHDRDLIGQIIVHGDPVDLDDVIIDDGVTHGIVETIDDLQEALAPTGDVKITTIDGQTVYGYDTRDANGNLGAITASPQDFVDNPWATSSLFTYASSLPQDLSPPVAVLSANNSVLVEDMSFRRANEDFVEVAHTGAMALVSGTLAFSFEVNALGDTQALVSKDARGWGDGGHLTIEVDNKGRVVARLQGEDGDGEFENVYLRSDEIEAGETYDLAFTFGPEGTALYLDGELVDRDAGFSAGISANGESLVVGAGTTTRNSGTLENLKEFLDGSVSDLVLLDRELTPGEVLFLAEEALSVETPAVVPASTAASNASPSIDTQSDAGEETSAPKVTSQSSGQPVPVPNSAHSVSSPPGNSESRDFYDPLGTTPPAAGVTLEGTAAGEELSGAVDTSGPGLPGALSFYSFANASGAGSATFADLRGGPSVTAYIDTGETATVSATLRAGPDGSPNSALEFDGDDTFAYLEHSPAWEVPQGTIALWVQPDDLSDDGMFLSKDLKGSGDGGHFRFGHEEDGTLFLRFANGDGSGNRAWESSIPYLEEGEWTHLAVSFSAEDGIVVYVDGVAVPDAGWIRTEGNEDLLSLQSEAYLTANREPWILGADTSRSEDTDSPNAFAAEHDGPRDAFDGALADFGIWGGPSADDVLSAEEVLELATNGPGNALTNPAGPQAMVAAADTINGGGGNDTIHGDAGDDILRGGAGEDSITGGYGNDRLEGDAGDDVLEGGRGSDLLLGGDGDDVLISHSDAGEQRIGQVAIGQPTRPDPDNEVNPERQKLYGWEDQPLIADDILVGGDGADTFLFNPQINGKRDIILQHVNDDRTIDWAGVAGENDELHDHWIDSFGIDVIADYVADEDTISIVGHTVAPRVEQRLIDTDGDGVLDEAISIITVYSMQHGGGGAHDRDLIGQIIVHGDPVDLDDVIIDDGVTHGIVETIDDLQEALAPTGDVKITTIDGQTVYGYDTRDANGNLGAITASPQDFVDNPWATSSLFTYASSLPQDLSPPVAVLSANNSVLVEDMSFRRANEDFVEVAHTGAMALVSGTLAFSFEVNALGDTQALVSKDARGWGDGGHLTIEVDNKGRVVARLQGEDGDGEFENVYLRSDEIEAGETYDLAFTFGPEGTALYLDGELVDRDAGFSAGISANGESLVVGAGTTTRNSGTLENLKEFLDGSVSDLVLLDRELTPGEVLFLAEEALSVETPAVVLSTSSPSSALVLTDEIYGSPLGETLEGGDGNDWIYGDDGNDILIGGRGQDTFVFAPFHGNDRIEDFDAELDSLALRDGLQIERLRAMDADGDRVIDDTMITFDSGDSVALIDVVLTEDELALI